MPVDSQPPSAAHGPPRQRPDRDGGDALLGSVHRQRRRDRLRVLPAAARSSATATGTTYTFSGLLCGQSYTLSVDAYDAKGNRSTASGMSASTAACAQAVRPAVAEYSFDAGSGTTLRDASGNGNNGSISGATWSPSGKFGGSLSFDGVNDMVTVADAASLDLTQKMTLEAWVKPTSAGSDWRTVILKERLGDLVYALYATTARAARAAMRTSVTPSTAMPSARPSRWARGRTSR